jgi:autophagy-related protein 11
LWWLTASQKEIYIYDIRMSQAPSSDGSPSVVSQVQPPKRYSIPNAPNSIENVQAIASWQELYKQRRAWAVHLLEDCGAMAATARARFEEMDVMIKCVDAAVANLELSVKQLEPKYTELKKWVEPALEEHARLSTSWQQYLALARNTPVSPSMVKFMTRGQATKSNATLEDLIEPDTANKAGTLAPTAHRRFSDKATELDRAAKKMYQTLDTLIADFDKLMNRSVLGRSDESSQLLQDIEAVVKQIDSDYRTALGYGGSQKDVAQASKTASNHTERLVPNLKKRAKEMDDLVQYVTTSRNTVASDAVEFMRAITEITSLRGKLKDHIGILNQSEDDMTTFDYLRLIQQLPYMYASFLAEAIRRQEWNEKIKTDSSTLANEMALFQDEEAKRRRRWQKMVGSTYGPGLDTNVMGLEVSVLGDDNSWPSANKDELAAFLAALKEQGTEEAILEDVDRLIQELNSPTKQQSKRLKAFKNGSVHEAALGRSGLMIRGDDDLLRSLQDDKSKLESKLKTAESRVRRLEDLLHRQSQASRPGNLFQPQTNSTHERNDSASSAKAAPADRQRASSEGTDSLLRRISELENELREEKQRSSRIQNDLSNRATQHDDMKDQIREVNSTKKDLLENMEALKREFVLERKSLEDEIKTLKARLEDTEDEIEHFGESREKERTSYEERAQQLEAELERVDKERKDEMLKAQGQVDFLRNENRIQREQRDTLERELHNTKDAGHATSKRLEALQEAADAHLQSLRELHSQLTGNDPVPEDGDLAEVIQAKATDLLARLQNMESDTSLTRGDLDRTRNQVKELREELSSTKDKLATEEAASIHVRESVSEEKAKAKALEHELAETREQLSSARARLADGETGSETLQKRVEEEEKKVTSLSEELASRQSQVGSLEEELHLYKEKLDAARARASELTERYETRDERSKDLTQRLYSQNDRLCHLLERLGYAVSRKEGTMTITKVPRAERQTRALPSGNQGCWAPRLCTKVQTWTSCTGGTTPMPRLRRRSTQHS